MRMLRWPEKAALTVLIVIMAIVYLTVLPDHLDQFGDAIAGIATMFILPLWIGLRLLDLLFRRRQQT